MVDKSRSRKAGGIGMGLALCQKIAEIHRANLVIESVVGQGTKISVVFQHRLPEGESTLPKLTALNFRLETGEQIAPSEMIAIDDELVMRFRAQDQTQNGGVDFVTNSTDEELLKLLSDPRESAYFYSKAGLEVGFNYESEEYGKGWVSVTLKERAL